MTQRFSVSTLLEELWDDGRSFTHLLGLSSITGILTGYKKGD